MSESARAFFGRRKGKTLKRRQRDALQRVLPERLVDLSQPPPERLTDLFDHPVERVCLEIGFGGGERLLHEASSNPKIGFIGVEPFENGLAKAAAAIERDDIRNIRLFDDDAALLLDWLPEASLARVDLLYPDPWPKLRHRKRRFVRSDNLDRIARVLTPKGVLRFASDVDAYVRWTVRETLLNGNFVWNEGNLDACRTPWDDWPGTRYEAKALAVGRGPAYLTFLKSGQLPAQ